MQAQIDRRRDRLNQLLCAFAVILVVIGSIPFTGTSFNDDWSYSHITLNFVRTGHIAYDGWCTPTLLLQVYWGSLLIHLFGFSFELLRFSTLPFAIGCAILSYRLARLAGLSPRSALFASLTFVASPLFIPLAASFMTDIYGAFFTLLSIYCGALACRQSSSRLNSSAWLAAAVFTGLIGGLDRQTVYIAPAAVLLCMLWRWRTDRTLAIATISLGAIFGLGALLVLTWQGRQFLGRGELADEVLGLRKAAIFPAQFILTLTLFTLPAAVTLGARALSVRARSYAIASILVLGSFFIYWRLAHRLLFPWLFNLITEYGILHKDEGMTGHRQPVLGQTMRMILTAAVLAMLIRITALLVESAMQSLTRPGLLSRIWSGFWNWPAALQISFTYTAAYFSLMTFQARLVVFDRYLLTVVPLTVILILYISREGAGRSPKTINWILLAIFGAYGITNTHDYFAGLRARQTAFQTLRKLGYPPARITGGFELDGWTQVELAGRVQYTPEGNSTPDPTRYYFLKFAPQIQPEYYISWSDEPPFQRSNLNSVPYKAWLPPFDREVKILVRKTN